MLLTAMVHDVIVYTANVLRSKLRASRVTLHRPRTADEPQEESDK